MAPRTVGDWAQRAATLPAVLVDSTPRAVRAGGEVLEAAARVNVLAATGGDSRLSRVRSGGARGNGGAGAGVIRLDLQVQGTGSRSRAVVVPRGPIMLIEDATRRHPIPRALRTDIKWNRRRVHARPGVWLPGIGFRRSVQHPGTKGKRPVRNAFRSHHDEAGKAGALVFATAARRHLGN